MSNIKVTTVDGEPTSVELDGKPIFVESMDILYRPCQRATINMSFYNDRPNSMELSPMVFRGISQDELDDRDQLEDRCRRAYEACLIFAGTPEFDAIARILQP